MQNYIEKEFIGVIGNRPIYKILRADITKLPSKINRRTLLIGDGVNTPFLIVKDALKAMYHFILESPFFNFKELDFPGNLGLTDTEILSYIVFNHDTNGHFIYHNFTPQNTITFKQMCKSNLLKTSYSENNGLDFNNWLHVNIGAFVWFNCKDLTDFITFSSYDYFDENYLKNTPITNTGTNIKGISDSIALFKDFILENKREINYNTFESIDDDFLYTELVSGNHWNLDNVYSYYKEREESRSKRDTEL
jgi:hypothetical protein